MEYNLELETWVLGAIILNLINNKIKRLKIVWTESTVLFVRLCLISAILDIKYAEDIYSLSHKNPTKLKHENPLYLQNLQENAEKLTWL